jgi:hypothetical protein
MTKHVSLLFAVLCVAGCSVRNRKAEWISDAFKAIEDARYSRIAAVSYWNEIWENEDASISDLRINSSSEALDAFREGALDSCFTSDVRYSEDSMKVLSPSKGIYFSAYPDFGDSEDTVTTARIEDFERLAGRPLAWVYFSNNWVEDIKFPREAAMIIHECGRLPFIRMMPRSTYEQGPDTIYRLQRIIDGDFDDALKKWARDAKAIGFPLMVEFGVEANGNWFPWSGVFNGGDTLASYGDPQKADGPERFSDAYKHIIDLFRGEGVANITWVFHVNSENFPGEGWNNMAAYYPGDSYIDWIGVSAYGALTPREARQDWMSFTDIMDDCYSEFAAISSSKPLAILEFGVVE